MATSAYGALAPKLILLVAMALQGCASGGLSEAAYNGNLARAQALVSHGADVNRYDRWGWTPLLWAVYYSHNAVARFLLENGADPNIPTVGEYGTVRTGSTPLIVAAYYGYAPTVRMLLEHGADPGKANDYGFTALMYAEEYGHEETKLLLKPAVPETPGDPDTPGNLEIEITPRENEPYKPGEER